MEITSTLYVTNPADWRAWLEKHAANEDEIWLIYYKKESGNPRIAYNDAVEQALCFGWIDSIVKNLDENRTAQRFCPRKPGSRYSQANIERLRILVSRGQVMPEVLESLGNTLDQDFIFPGDILEAIQADETAWQNYQSFSEPYKRIRVAFIQAARKRPEEFEKRLSYFIKMTRANRRYGFGGIEKYF